MIDFHTHILPGIDDGSRDIRETKNLLLEEYNQGVTQILLTPHFYANQDSIPHFLTKREQSLQKLKALLQEDTSYPEVKVAAEVYYFPGMGTSKVLPNLCMENSSLLLLEMPFAQWNDEIYNDVKNMIEKQHLTVVIAHVERYYKFQKDTSYWNDILDLPLYLQINAGGLLKMGGRRRLDLQLLKSGTPIVLGSDCHNMESRPPTLKAGRDFIAKKMGSSVLENIDALGKELWNHVK